MVPQDIIKWVKPAPKIIVAPRMRKCISIKDYNAKKLGSGAASSSGAVAQSHFDDPDASFSEGSLSEGED